MGLDHIKKKQKKPKKQDMIWHDMMVYLHLVIT